MRKFVTPIGVASLAILFWSITSSFAIVPHLAVEDEIAEWRQNGTIPNVEPLFTKTIRTSADITIHYCYISESAYKTVYQQSAKDKLPSDPDCVLGTGECWDAASNVRVVFLPISN